MAVAENLPSRDAQENPSECSQRVLRQRLKALAKLYLTLLGPSIVLLLLLTCVDLCSGLLLEVYEQFNLIFV